MELRQLRYFFEIARLSSFTKAAETLYVAQPALSRQIMNLEEKLGIMLFDRHNRIISLTKDGEAFLEKTKVILKKVEEAKTEVEERKGLKKGSITLGLPSTTGSYYFPKIISEFKNIYPDIEISLVEEGTIKIFDMIKREEIDLGVIVSPINSQEVESAHLLSQEIYVCLPSKHPLAKHKKISFEDLKNDSFILFKDGYFYRKFIIQESDKAGFFPNIILETNQVEMIKSLISLNLGISLFIKIVVEDDDRITTVPIEPSMTLDLSIAWKKDKYLTDAVSSFLEFLKQFHI